MNTNIVHPPLFTKTATQMNEGDPLNTEIKPFDFYLPLNHPDHPHLLLCTPSVIGEAIIYTDNHCDIILKGVLLYKPHQRVPVAVEVTGLFEWAGRMDEVYRAIYSHIQKQYPGREILFTNSKAA